MDTTDADFGYTTNQSEIVSHAKWCYENYPTIENNIPKDKNIYTNSLDDFAKVDNLLSASQTDIGESSNLAQIAQSYSYTFSDPRFDDYCAILAVIAQAAIDSSKRTFDIDIPKEIKLIKQQMNVKENGYPMFWSVIRPGFNKNNLSSSLHCPMNYLYNIKFSTFKPKTSNLPMDYFFIKHKMTDDKRKCKKVEEFIQKYSLKLYDSRIENNKIDDQTYLLLRSDYEQLIKDLSMINLSKNSVGVMSWLLDRAFIITPVMKSNKNTTRSTLSKNRSLLVKVLYDVNKKTLFSCFQGK